MPYHPVHPSDKNCNDRARLVRLRRIEPRYAVIRDTMPGIAEVPETQDRRDQGGDGQDQEQCPSKLAFRLLHSFLGFCTESGRRRKGQTSAKVTLQYCTLDARERPFRRWLCY